MNNGTEDVHKLRAKENALKLEIAEIEKKIPRMMESAKMRRQALVQIQARIAMVQVHP